MADRTGLEPATSGVTGRHSNQLNYRSAKGAHVTMLTRTLHLEIVTGWLFRPSFFTAAIWWVERDLNPRHSPCKGDALPTELSTRRVG